MEIKNQMKVLFLVPHLSTGGMPQFLLKRIQALKEYSDVEIFVYEWTQTSKNYTVQRKQIRKLIPHSNFVSCGMIGEVNINTQNNISNYLRDNKIDIIHIEDEAEAFLPEYVIKELYDPKQPWKIIETPHSLNFNPDRPRIYKPNGYCFTITHHKTIGDEKIKTKVIKYPLDSSIVCEESRDEILSDIGWRLNGEHHILNVGLWTPSKNQEYALELAKKFWYKYGWTYIFHFVGNQAPNFQDYWEPLMNNLPPNIRIHGEKNEYETSKFYKMADLLLFTSTWESWGIVIEEAIVNKLRIMAYDLDHYGDERIPFIEPLSGDIDKDYELLLNTIHSKPKYKLDIYSDNLKYFARKHIEFYRELAEDLDTA